MKAHKDMKDKLNNEDEGYEPADSPFMKEGTDTAGYATKPEDLCDECKPFGFCKRGNPERFEAYTQEALIKNNIR